MAHTIQDKKKLLNRVRRLRGQIEAVERLLETEHECFDVLQQIAAVRGSINSLMAEVLEGHIRCHVGGSAGAHSPQQHAIEELVTITRSYLK